MNAEDRGRREGRSAVSDLLRHDLYLGPQLLAAAPILLDLALPERLAVGFGPRWLVPALEGLVLLALIVSSPHRRTRHSPVRRGVSLGLIGLVSAINIVSTVRLCVYLVQGGHAGGRTLIGSGMLLWANNVLLFALWFWQLDRGGPVARAGDEPARPDFLFVQMTEPRHAPPDWKPGLIDYVYTSLTNATAFSPTDTMPLTATAKCLMGAQALTALVTVGLVVARAVNILS